MFIKRTTAALTSAMVFLCGTFALEGFAAGGTVTISQQECDIDVIPDRYNTGAKGSLTKVSPSDTVCGIELKQGGDKVSSMIDLTDRNQSISGEVVIENYDFSDFIIRTRKEDETGRDIKLVFRNCKFDAVEKGRTDSRVTYVFENCTFRRFSGSNAVLSRCALGGSYNDAIVPFRNVTVEDCYISDMVQYFPGGEVHTDGTQIYGAEGIDVKNISFDNCRFEIPYLRIDGNKATVNACIMLQLEYSSAKDVSFTDCILNGGGTYSIYTTIKNRNNKAAPWKIENAVFDNVQIGCSVLKSAVYPTQADGINFKDIHGTDSLYVASVYKENGKTMFSVTNDTAQPRTLKIVTKNSTYSYNIPAAPTGVELENKKITSFSQMPADRLITVPEDADYAVCLDATEEKNIRQIRFVNYSGKSVSLDKSVFGGDEALANNILYEGVCGNGLTYTYSKDHVLTISGSGNMDNYHSQFDPPWFGYAGQIKKVVVEEGVSSIGNMAFRDCYGMKEVSLPEGLVTIGSRAFSGCLSLERITVPVSVTDIKENAFITLSHCDIVYLNPDRTLISFAPKFAGDEIRTPDDVKLKIGGKVFTSDKTGKVTIVGLAHGRYEAEISKPNYAPVKVNVTVGGTNGTFVIYKYGDVNGDGEINLSDLGLMQQKLCDWDVHYIYDGTADTNGDGKHNINDLGLLQQYLCEWKVTFGKTA